SCIGVRGNGISRREVCSNSMILPRFRFKRKANRAREMKKPPEGGFILPAGARLLFGLRRGSGHGGGFLLVLGREVIALPEILVELAGDLRGAGAEGGPAAFEEEDRHHAALRRIRIRREPAKAGSLFGTGSGLAEDWKFLEVGAQATGGAVLHRARHAVLQIGQELSDIQGPLHLGLKGHRFFESRRVLQVVKRSSIGDGGYKGPQLQRSHLDALTEA